jgi:hypothetical protein
LVASLSLVYFQSYILLKTMSSTMLFMEGMEWASDGWRVVDDDDYRQAVGEPQAEGVMSIAASFSLS